MTGIGQEFIAMALLNLLYTMTATAAIAFLLWYARKLEMSKFARGDTR